MNAIAKVLNRVIVVEFYRQNAAFFGLILLVFFGFIRSNEHIAIGTFLIDNPSALVILFAIWLIYGVKVALFILPAINREENQFLESFYLLPFRVQFITTTLAAILLLMPIVVYALFLITLAIPGGFYLSVISLLLSIVVFTVALSVLLRIKLNGLPHEKSFFQIKLFRKALKPPYLFFIEHVLRNEIVLLILTKLYSCLLIAGTALLYETDQYDLRLLTTGVLIAFVGNVAIVYKYLWFQYHQLAFSINLPQSLMKLLIRIGLTFFILLTPEFLVLFRHYPLDPTFPDLLGIVLFGISLCAFIYSLLLIKQVELSQFMTSIFWMVVITIIFILFSIHPFILGISYIGISVFIISRQRYQYEYND